MTENADIVANIEQKIIMVCRPALRKMEERAGLGKRKRPGHESNYECAKCSVSLCVTPCFEMYHTYLDYENAYIVWQRSKNVYDNETLLYISP